MMRCWGASTQATLSEAIDCDAYARASIALVGAQKPSVRESSGCLLRERTEVAGAYGRERRLRRCPLAQECVQVADGAAAAHRVRLHVVGARCKLHDVGCMLQLVCCEKLAAGVRF